MPSPTTGHFKGSNFVFDGRLKMGPAEAEAAAAKAAEEGAEGVKPSSLVVGHCVHCGARDDALSDSVVCTVCKSFVILCASCRTGDYAQKKWNVFCAEHMLLAAAEGAPEIGHTNPRKQQQQSKRQKREGDAQQAAQDAADSSAAAASASPAASAAPMEDAPDDDASASAASSGLGCPEQVSSFLSRFSLEQLEAQLAEFDAILAYFALPAQRKAASKSRNRKQNLHTQRKRLAAYVLERRKKEGKTPTASAEQESKEQTNETAAAAAAPGVRAAQPAVVSTVAPPQFLSFVPFLNV